jgi:DNA-binding winged helix-turn-helix (wHTH) protein
MTTDQLLIAERFCVSPGTHIITDLSTGESSRLEPRLIRLLLLLAETPGQLVSREQIIRDIWNDYGGAEDALNQAISFLRKTLDDAARDRIRTVPKKGYLLNTTVQIGPDLLSTAVQKTAESPDRDSPLNTKRPVKKAVILSLIILLTVSLLLLGRKTFFPATVQGREPEGAVEDTLYQYQEMKQQK